MLQAYTTDRFFLYHALRGSASPALTATGFVNRKWQFSTPYRIDTSAYHQLGCEPIPNVMAALPNTGGAPCSTPQSLADAHYSSAVQ